MGKVPEPEDPCPLIAGGVPCPLDPLLAPVLWVPDVVCAPSSGDPDPEPDRENAGDPCTEDPPFDISGAEPPGCCGRTQLKAPPSSPMLGLFVLLAMTGSDGERLALGEGGDNGWEVEGGL